MRTVALLIALAFAVPALAQEPSKEDLLNTVRHIQRLAKEQQSELDAAHAHELALDTQLTEANKNLGTATGQITTLQGEIDTMAEHDAKATADKAHILKKYHFLKMLACLIAAAAAIFGVMQLTRFIPMAVAPYKIYLYGGAGVLAATLVATLL